MMKIPWHIVIVRLTTVLKGNMAGTLSSVLQKKGTAHLC